MPNLHYKNTEERIKNAQQLYKTMCLCFGVLKVLSFVIAHLAV